MGSNCCLPTCKQGSVASLNLSVLPVSCVYFLTPYSIYVILFFFFFYLLYSILGVIKSCESNLGQPATFSPAALILFLRLGSSFNLTSLPFLHSLLFVLIHSSLFIDCVYLFGLVILTVCQLFNSGKCYGPVWFWLSSRLNPPPTVVIGLTGDRTGREERDNRKAG